MNLGEQDLQVLQEIDDGKKHRPSAVVNRLISTGLVEAERNDYEDGDEFPFHYNLTDAGRDALQGGIL